MENNKEPKIQQGAYTDEQRATLNKVNSMRENLLKHLTDKPAGDILNNAEWMTAFTQLSNGLSGDIHKTANLDARVKTDEAMLETAADRGLFLEELIIKQGEAYKNIPLEEKVIDIVPTKTELVPGEVTQGIDKPTLKEIMDTKGEDE